MAMSKEHKEALARGRLEARSIKAYLNALDARRPGRPVTKESLEQRLGRINAKLDPAEATPALLGQYMTGAGGAVANGAARG